MMRSSTVLLCCAVFALGAAALAACAPTPVVVIGPAALAPQTAGEVRELTGAALAGHLQGAPAAETMAVLDKALRLAPRDFEAHELAGYLAYLQGDDGGAFAHWTAAIATADPRAEYLLIEVSRLEPTPARRRTLRPLLAALFNDLRTPPLLRARAAWANVAMARFDGDLEGARRAAAALHWVPEWAVMGPFDNAQNAGFATAYAPESGIDFKATEDGKRAPVAWRQKAPVMPDGRLGLHQILEPRNWAVAYAVTDILAEREESAVLRFAVNDQIKVWFNGALVFTQSRNTMAALDHIAVPVVVRAGRNRLLVKIAQRTGDWVLGARVTAPGGEPLGGLRYEASDGPLEERAAAKAAFSYEPDFGRRAARERKADPFAAFREARWLTLAGMNESSVRRFEALHQRHQKAILPAYYLARAYQHTSKPGDHVKMLEKVMAADPALPRPALDKAFHYLDIDLNDKALEGLRAAVAKAPGFRAAQLALAEHYADRGWWHEAEGLHTTLARVEPESAHLAALAGRIFNARGLKDEAAAAYRRQFAWQVGATSGLPRLIDLAEQRGDVEEALRLIGLQIRLEPLETGYLLRQAEILKNHRRYDEAWALCERAAAIKPGDHRVARLKGFIRHWQGRDEEAAEAWKTSLRLEPDDTRLRDYAEFLAPEGDTFFKDNDLTAAEEMALVTTPVAAEAYPRAAAAILLDLEATRVHRDGSSKSYIHRIIRILTPSGRDRYSRIRLNGPGVRVLKAETILPGGEVREVTSLSSAELRFPELAPGAVINYVYTVDRYSGGWLDEHYYTTFWFQEQDPVLQARWTLSLPPGKQLARAVSHPELVREEKLADNVWRWSSVNAPMIEEENRRPPFGDVAARVDVSTIPSWDILANWQISLIKDQFDINHEIRAMVKKLTAGAATPMDKLRAIHKFIVQDIRYLYADVGIFGKKPDHCVNIFGNKFGDCKDKATLMIAMLAEAGIKAHYAALRTRDRGAIVPAVPASQTNHVITYVPAQEGIPEPFFVDGTATFLAAGALPFADQGVQALILRRDGWEYVATPVLEAEANVMAVAYDIELVPEQGATITAHAVTTGENAAYFRGTLRNKGTQTDVLERWLNRYWKGAKVFEARASDLDTLADPVEVDFAATVPDFLTPEPGGAFTFKPGHTVAMVESYADKNDRLYDLDMKQRGVFRTRQTYRLPAGFVFGPLPEPVVLENPHYRVALDYQLEGTDKRALAVTASYLQRSILVPKADYAEFRGYCVRVTNMQNRNLTIVREAPAAPARQGPIPSRRPSSR